MHEPLDLTPIKARLAAVSPIPWRYHDNGIDGVILDGSGFIVTGGESGEGRLEGDDPNTIFIAHAPTDMTALVAEVEGLRKTARNLKNELCLKCGRYREAHNGSCDGCRWKE